MPNAGLRLFYPNPIPYPVRQTWPNNFLGSLEEDIGYIDVVIEFPVTFLLSKIKKYEKIHNYFSIWGTNNHSILWHLCRVNLRPIGVPKAQKQHYSLTSFIVATFITTICTHCVKILWFLLLKEIYIEHLDTKLHIVSQVYFFIWYFNMCLKTHVKKTLLKKWEFLILTVGAHLIVTVKVKFIV